MKKRFIFEIFYNYIEKFGQPKTSPKHSDFLCIIHAGFFLNYGFSQFLSLIRILGVFFTKNLMVLILTNLKNHYVFLALDQRLLYITMNFRNCNLSM